MTFTEAAVLLYLNDIKFGNIPAHRKARKEILALAESYESIREACKKLIKFTDEILPQAGKLCFDIGNLNDALIQAHREIKKGDVD